MVEGKEGPAGPDDIPVVPLLRVQKPVESLLSPIDRRSDFYRHAALELPHKAETPQPLLTIPNVLTFFRLLLVPVLVVLWESGWRYAPISCGIVFAAASITDYFDGYLARKLKIATVFGAFLDPVADKIMVATALILLAVSPPSPWSARHMTVPSSLIICREITMSALREWAAASGGAASKAVKVNTLGKWKTALQMVSMSALLLVRQPAADIWPTPTGELLFLLVSRLSFWGLWAGTFLGVWSLAIYFKNVWVHFVYPEGSKKAQ